MSSIHFCLFFATSGVADAAMPGSDSSVPAHTEDIQMMFATGSGL